jgi:hypothetical protein
MGNMKALILPFVLILAIATLAQSDLPDKGTLADIKGKSKVYLAIDAENIKAVQKEIQKQKQLQVVDKAEDSEFIIEYKKTNLRYVTDFNFPVETGQLDVYFSRNSKKVIVWTESGSKSMKPPSADLVNKFLKTFIKN